MIDEPSRRRPGFLRGPLVQLADGREWAFSAETAALGPALGGLLDGIVEAENRPEVLRAGLALALFLITTNYDLAPEELQALLAFPTGGRVEHRVKLLCHHDGAPIRYGRARWISVFVG